MREAFEALQFAVYTSVFLASISILHGMWW